MKVILASASPRRAQLLNQVGLRFETDPAEINEALQNFTDPQAAVKTLAGNKAENVAKRHTHSFIIAADTVVCLESEILGKPKDEKQATNYLQRLSGRTHVVYSGVCYGVTKSSGALESAISFSERTKVTFSALSELEIEQYIKYGKPFDKAGSYGIQDDRGSLFVKRIEGDYYNVVGFPLHRFYDNLRKNMPEIHKELFLSFS